jgi:hypothetical protein
MTEKAILLGLLGSYLPDYSRQHWRFGHLIRHPAYVHVYILRKINSGNFT